MTGRRLRKGTPPRPVGAAQRSRARFEQRVTRSGTAAHRLSAATSYLVAVLKRAEPGLAVRTAEAMYAALLEAASHVEAANQVAALRRKERA